MIHHIGEQDELLQMLTVATGYTCITGPIVDTQAMLCKCYNEAHKMETICFSY